MSNKNKTIALASLIAAGAGVAAVAQPHYMQKRRVKTSRQKIDRQEKRQTKHRNETSTAIQNAVSMKKTAKVFIIPTVTTRHLHIRKNRKVSMRKAHTS